jgi:C1A family cysteine protease
MMMLRAAMLLGLLGLALARPVEKYQTTLSVPMDLSAEDVLANPLAAFEQWMSFHQKSYSSEKEHAKRLDVFKANAAFVSTKNAAQSSMRLALNQFADQTWEEFSSKRLALMQASNTQSDTEALPFTHANVTDIPASIDWRTKGAVAEVKNQGACGSCWAFSTVGAIEGINAIQTGKLVSLSEQQLVSCDTEKDMGCGGGLMDYAFKYVIENGGLDTEEDYAYWGMGLPCQAQKAKDRTVVTIDGFSDVPKDDMTALKKAVSQQPVSVAICANSALQFYSSGIFTDDQCCQGLNHGVIAVGYNDQDKDASYLVIKNSWGAWGENGYFRLSTSSKHKEGACGVLQAASYPVKKGTTNPAVPTFCGYFGLHECPVHTTCQCEFELFGFCWPYSWGCQSKSEDMA